MLRAKPLFFLNFWMLLAWSLGASPAHSDLPRVEIGVPALNLELDSLRADWPERSQAIVDRWLDEHYEAMASDDSDITREALGSLMSYGVGIGHELLSAHEAMASYSHYRAVRKVSKGLPRVAWVGMADRTRYTSRYIGALRYTVEAGTQFAVLGSPEVSLKDGKGQLLLRVLPFGASQEKARLGFYRSSRLMDPDARIEPSAAVETEGNLKWGSLQPGGRFRLQSEFESDAELRMLAEAFVKIEIKHRFDDFREVSIVPRCVWDRTLNGEHDRSTKLASSFAKGYDELHSVQICTLNIRFRYGKRY